MRVTRTSEMVRASPERVAGIPEKLKAVVLFPTWIVASAILYSVIAYVIPGFLPAILVAASFGLAFSLAFVERRLLDQWRNDRAQDRARMRALKAERLAAHSRQRI